MHRIELAGFRRDLSRLFTADWVSKPMMALTLSLLRKVLTQRLYGVWCIPPMKVTFELPPPVVHRLRSHIPSGERSRFVAELITKKLQGKLTALEQAAQKASRLTPLNREMNDWEALNEHED